MMGPPGFERSVLDVIAPVVIYLSLFTMIFLSFYFYLKARHSERMALIEKSGGDLSLFQKGFEKDTGSLIGLKIGMFLIGIAIGLLTATILTRFLYFPSAVIYISMILIFGGLSLILYYPVSEKYFKK